MRTRSSSAKARSRRTFGRQGRAGRRPRSRARSGGGTARSPGTQADVAGFGRHVDALAGQQPPVGRHLTAVQRLQPGDQAQQGALAAAGWPQQAGDAAGLQRQAGAVDRGLVAIAAADLARLDGGRSSRRLRAASAATLRDRKTIGPHGRRPRSAAPATPPGQSLVGGVAVGQHRKGVEIERAAGSGSPAAPSARRRTPTGPPSTGAGAARGVRTRQATPASVSPRLRAARSIDGVTRASPASIGCSADAISRAE